MAPRLTSSPPATLGDVFDQHFHQLLWGMFLTAAHQLRGAPLVRDLAGVDSAFRLQPPLDDIIRTTVASSGHLQCLSTLDKAADMFSCPEHFWATVAMAESC